MTDFLAAVVEVGPEAWREQAACIGEPFATFFPESGQTAAAAKAICAGCPVRAECLSFALTTGEHHGVWGGMSERERRRLRPRRQPRWTRCTVCGKPYQTANARQAACSKACRQRAYVQRKGIAS